MALFVLAKLLPRLELAGFDFRLPIFAGDFCINNLAAVQPMFDFVSLQNDLGGIPLTNRIQPVSYTHLTLPTKA